MIWPWMERLEVPSAIHSDLNNILGVPTSDFALKSEINEIIFSSPSGKMDTDFFTFCLILERKKIIKNLLRWGSNPRK